MALTAVEKQRRYLSKYPEKKAACIARVKAWEKINRPRMRELEAVRRKTTKYKEYQKQYYKNNKQKARETSLAEAARLKDLVISSYGGKCACCGEADKRFLSLDHVNNDGYIERKTLKGSKGSYRLARKENYPDRYQVLCFNCNCAKKNFGGVCPHKISPVLQP